MMQIKIALVIESGQIFLARIERGNLPRQLFVLLFRQVVPKGSKVLLLTGSVLLLVRHVIVDGRTGANHLLQLVAHRQIVQERKIAIGGDFAIEHYLHMEHLYARTHQAAHRLRHDASAFDLVREGVAHRQFSAGARQYRAHTMALLDKRNLTARHELLLFDHAKQRLLVKLL